MSLIDNNKTMFILKKHYQKIMKPYVRNIVDMIITVIILLLFNSAFLTTGNTRGINIVYYT